MADTEAILFPSQEYDIPVGLAYLKLPEAILEISEAVEYFIILIAKPCPLIWSLYSRLSIQYKLHNPAGVEWYTDEKLTSMDSLVIS